MLGRYAVPLLALVIVALTGCATGTSSQPPANVNGTWTGGLVGDAATVTLVLKQDGNHVTGSLTGAGTLDGPIEGTVDGDTLRLREKGGMTNTPMLDVKGDQITGLMSGSRLQLRRVK